MWVLGIPTQGLTLAGRRLASCAISRVPVSCFWEVSVQFTSPFIDWMIWDFVRSWFFTILCIFSVLASCLMCSWEIFPFFYNLFSSGTCSPPFQKLCHFMVFHLLIPEDVSSITGVFISKTTWLRVETFQLYFPFPGPIFQILHYDFCAGQEL